MKITHVSIENFRAHSKTDVPLTQLGCLIGENNAGKSSILHAIQIALDDRRIDTDDFRDPELPITIIITLEQIEDQDLQRVEERHRTKLLPLISDGKLKLVKQQNLGDKPQSLYVTKTPVNPEWKKDALEERFKGKTGAALKTAAIELHPAMAAQLAEATTVRKADVLSAWTSIQNELPAECFEETYAALPTGISAGIKPLLPSVIYIEAVKDAASEARPTGSSAFAKLLAMLFEEVQEQFQDIESQFRAVHRKLSRQPDEEGGVTDDRLPAVKNIETAINENVRLSFPGVNVRMEIPSPTLSILLSSAHLLVTDDDHEGDISTKGDGLKRTVLFALLRAYTSMRAEGITEESRQSETGSDALSPQPHILLFEEPELYLHPRAQRQLMTALSDFAKNHQVLVTTHSPGFFQPTTKGFTRLRKNAEGVRATPVDLSMSLRDAYQLVQHENNEAAFFANAVVLVEGDSDTFVYPHLAKLLSPDWDHVEKNIAFLSIEGKGNIKRYREFFEAFEVPVHVITDLDALVDGFTHLTSTESITTKHGRLMNLVSQEVKFPSQPKSDHIKDLKSSYSARQLWQQAQETFSEWRDSKSTESALKVEHLLGAIFEKGTHDDKLRILGSPHMSNIEQLRDDVIANLALEQVYVLSRGDLEFYCGTPAKAKKVDIAIRFCNEIDTEDKLRAKHGEDSDALIGELRGIFSKIYD